MRALPLMRTLSAAYTATMRWLPRQRETESSHGALSGMCVCVCVSVLKTQVPIQVGAAELKRAAGTAEVERFIKTDRRQKPTVQDWGLAAGSAEIESYFKAHGGGAH